MDLEIEYIHGVEGNSLSLNETRIAGPKPWGGGKVLWKRKTTIANLRRALEGTGYTITETPTHD